MGPQELSISEEVARFGSAEFWCYAAGIAILAGVLVGFVELRTRDVLEQRAKETGSAFTWKTKAVLYAILFFVGAGVGAPLGAWLGVSVLVGIVCGAIGGVAGSWIVKLGKRVLKRRLEKGKG